MKDSHLNAWSEGRIAGHSLPSVPQIEVIGTRLKSYRWGMRSYLAKTQSEEALGGRSEGDMCINGCRINAFLMAFLRHFYEHFDVVKESGQFRFWSEANSMRKAAYVVAGIFLAVMISLCTLGAQGQSTFGNIRGTVSDSTGAAVPGAKATLHSVDQSDVHSTVSDNAGEFVFENLNPGRYVLQVDEQGFAETKLNGLVLEARQSLRVPVTLTVSTQNTTVEVNATAEAINTEDASISDSKSNSLITELPLNNRATTTSPLGALSVSPNVQQDSSGNVAVDGASYSMTNYSVDGISTDNVRQNGPLNDAYPSQEGIAAVKVTAFNNSAEFSQVAT